MYRGAYRSAPPADLSAVQANIDAEAAARAAADTAEATARAAADTTLQTNIDNAKAPTVSAQTISSANTQITVPSTDRVIAKHITISGAGTVIASSASIAAGTDGQVMILANMSALPFTLQDHAEGSPTGSKLRLTAASITIAQYDSVAVMYDSGLDRWFQISPHANNLAT